MSQFGETEDPANRRRRAAWSLPEVVAMALLVIISILIVASLISALATQSLFVSATGPDRNFTVALALERAGQWASPQSAALFVLGSLALAWWQVESWTNDDGDPFDADAFVHLRRARIVTHSALVLSLLTIVGGVLLGVGASVEESSNQNWSIFAQDLGLALGSVVLGVAGVVAARRLQASGLAAVTTWPADPTVA